MESISINNTRQLRQDLKAARSALSPIQQQRAARQVARKVAKLPEYRRARHVAAYLASKGEIDLRYLLAQLFRNGKQCYLPILHPRRHGQLWFRAWSPHEPLQSNRFGIAEPTLRRSRLRDAGKINLVLVPLLGFDAKGHRIGMGGGYYDRSFAFVRRAATSRRPILIGVGHDLQRVGQIIPQSWDIRLDAVITDRNTYRNASRRNGAYHT